MLKSITNISFVILIVKLVGFIKQAVIAAYFGASELTDTYLLVSELLESLGEVLFSSIAVSFLTIYTDIIINDNKKERNQFVSSTLIYGIPVAIVLSFIVFLFAEPISYILAPGYSDIEIVNVVRYMKILSFSIVMMFIASVCRAILDAEKFFIPSKLEGIIKSIITILSCVFLSETLGTDVLIWSLLAYYVVTDIYLIFNVYRRIRVKLLLPKKDSRLGKLLILSVPLFISNGSVYLHSIVDKAIGSTLSEGSISILSYSGYLTNTIHSLIVGSVCTVLFSYFSSYVSEKKHYQLIDTIKLGTRLLLIIMTGIAVVMIICSDEIVSIVYGRGVFTEYDVQRTATVMAIYSIGLIFISIRDLLIRVNYAYKDTKTAMINGVTGMIINVMFSILLSKMLGVYGIVLATVIANMVMMVMAAVTVKKCYMPKVKYNLIPLFVEVALIGGLIIFVGHYADIFFNNCNVIFSGFVKAAIGTTTYIGILLVLKNKELYMGISKIKEKFRI